MIKKIFLNIFLILNFVIFLCHVDAAEVQQSVIVNFPAVNNVSVTGGNLTTTIDPITGNLNSELSSIFNISTNNNRGVYADFSVEVNTWDGSCYGAKGTTYGSNTGVCVLANNDFEPSPTSISNALNLNTTPSSNPNVIGYEIEFKAQTPKGSDPVFYSAYSYVASGRVLQKKGNATVTVKIRNNANINNKTFNNLTDAAGSYQATIYCTIYNP